MGRLADFNSLGFPAVTLIAAALFTWYASQKYQSDLNGIETRISLRLETLEKTVSHGTGDRFTRADFYVWCSTAAKNLPCDSILRAPSFAITGSPMVIVVRER
jgi:hypothetical protein